jgi:hypothetical protein
MEDIKVLVDEVKEIVRSAENGRIYERSRSYWIPHILMAIDDTHGYLGRSMYSMADALNELEKELETENED